MDKEKQLEELRYAIRHANDENCECKCESCFNCTADNMAKAVYNEGFRRVDEMDWELFQDIKKLGFLEFLISKVNEVQKETVKNILTIISAFEEENYLHELKRNIARYYGVEVENA